MSSDSTYMMMTAWVVGAMGAAMVGWVGCVQTAECNASVGCPDGEVCFDYVCRPRCEVDGDCDESEACRPCDAPNGEGGENVCFGQSARACMPAGDRPMERPADVGDATGSDGGAEATALGDATADGG